MKDLVFIYCNTEMVSFITDFFFLFALEIYIKYRFFLSWAKIINLALV